MAGTEDGRSGSRKPNHLAGQTSPYLLQHLYNPVDWYPWGPEALARARDRDLPVFLSIGYAACHWCHVMERESFEDPAIAAYLNEHFVPIKVDREERPDLDEVYMNAVQVLTGQGGWPLNTFLTPQLEPFLGGTYFPPTARYGRAGFPEVLRQVHEAWISRRHDIERAGGELADRLRQIAAGGVDGASTESVGLREFDRAAGELAGRFESRWGGFSGAPKFPADGALELLLVQHARGGEPVPLQMLQVTLDGMARGGLYDHVGGGFARYSVDERWLVPHFEKMLYNQALLAPVYLDAWRVTGKPLYRRVCEETLDFVRREMTGAAGGLYSSLDADSEGVEGKFYVWSPEEVCEILGPADGALFNEVYGIRAGGNFEGRSIPNLLERSLEQHAAARGVTEQVLADELRPLGRRLLEARGRRVRPATDDKILTAWNGLMIGAFSRAYQALGRPEDLRAAERAAEFVLERLWPGERLLVSWREGRAQWDAFLDDHAFLARGLLDLYEANFDVRYLERSAALADEMLARFEDPESGGFFFTAEDRLTPVARNRSMHDGALPSGAGVAVEVLLRLAIHLDRDDLRGAAERTLRSYRPAVERMPSAFSSLLLAAALAVKPPPEVALVGRATAPEMQALLQRLRRSYRFRPVVQLGADGEAPGPRALLRDKGGNGRQATAFVCRDYACREPTSDPERLDALLGGCKPGGP